MTISTPRPPHRLERLRSWMDDEQIDCTVVFGADNVNHLCGYWRYFGGPSALVIGRDGERTLVVMLDEAPIAERLSDADEVLGYGERGFGIDLDPVAGLVDGSRRRSPPSRGRTASASPPSSPAPMPASARSSPPSSSTPAGRSTGSG